MYFIHIKFYLFMINNKSKWGSVKIKFNTIQELLDYTENIKGKQFKEFDINHELTNKTMDKGKLGKLVETGFYHYPNNSYAQADFDNIGVELKVSGYVKSKTGRKGPKERISLSMINYMEIVKEEFEFSKMIYKNKKILILWYEYDRGIPYKEFTINNFQLYDMEKDIPQIKKDFEDIRQKVRDGIAEEISEGDTKYLGACTKGSKAIYNRRQPYSRARCKSRAYSLKQSYLRKIFNEMEWD